MIWLARLSGLPQSQLIFVLAVLAILFGLLVTRHVLKPDTYMNIENDTMTAAGAALILVYCSVKAWQIAPYSRTYPDYVFITLAILTMAQAIGLVAFWSGKLFSKKRRGRPKQPDQGRVGRRPR